MNESLSISIPKGEKRKIKKSASKLGISASKYVLHCIKLEREMISEEKLLKSIKDAKKDYKAGKLKSFKSLKDFTLK